MSGDFYISAAATRASQIEAELQAARADLAAHRANGDLDSGAHSVSHLASLEAERHNLLALHNYYIASQQPPQAPRVSAEERHAKPWSRMDSNDILELTRTSKYAKNIDWNDAGMQAGWYEAQRRRAYGE